MKRTLTVLCLLSIGLPVFADIVNPNLTKEQREQLEKVRYERYLERSRIQTLNRLCQYNNNNIQDIDIDKCKQSLKEDYEETIKILEEKYEKESKANDNKVFKNASK